MKRLVFTLLVMISVFLLSACGEEAIPVYTITVVSDPSPLIVDRDTLYSDIPFSDELQVLLDDGSIVNVEVEWPQQISDYDVSLESIIVRGTIIESDTILNTSEFVPEQVLEFAPIDVVDTIALFPEYSIFYNALLASSIIDGLDDTIEYTFLLPTNEAFTIFLADLNITVDDFMDSDLMDDIVRSHIVTDNYSQAVLRASSPTTVNVIDESSVTVTLVDSILQLNETTTIIGEMNASNGNILELDNVILPSITSINDVNDGLMTILMANLMGVIQDQNLLRKVLFGDGITVFIPSEQAVITLLLQYGLTIEDMSGSDEFIDIITHHIIGDYYSAEELYTNAPLTIENTSGTTFNITVVDGVLMIEDATIISSTVNDQFGVMHEIDSFLLTEEMISFLESYEPSE